MDALLTMSYSGWEVRFYWDSDVCESTCRRCRVEEHEQKPRRSSRRACFCQF